MMELPLKTRRSARLMRLVTLFGIALLVITTLFAAWTSVAGEPRHDTVSMHVDSRGLAGWPAATVLLLVGSLLVIALSYLVAMLRRVEAGAPFAAAPQLRGFARFVNTRCLCEDGGTGRGSGDVRAVTRETLCEVAHPAQAKEKGPRRGPFVSVRMSSRMAS